MIMTSGVTKPFLRELYWSLDDFLWFWYDWSSFVWKSL